MLKPVVCIIAGATIISALFKHEIGTNLRNSRYHFFDSRETVKQSEEKSFSLISMIDNNRVDAPPVRLKIPRSYINIENKDELKFNSPVYFYLTYPDMLGGLDSRNEDITRCVGACRGLTQVTIFNSSTSGSKITDRLESYASDKMHYSLVKSGYYSRTLEEYDVMWVHYPFRPWPPTESRGPSKDAYDPAQAKATLPTPPPGFVSQETFAAYSKHPWPAAHIVTFGRGEPHQYDIIECKVTRNTEFKPGPHPAMCEYYGSMDRNRNIKFRIFFPYNLISVWPDFKKSVVNLIGTFIVI